MSENELTAADIRESSRLARVHEAKCKRCKGRLEFNAQILFTEYTYEYMCGTCWASQSQSLEAK